MGEIRTFVHCWLESKMEQVLWKTFWQFLKKFSMQLLYYPESLHLSILPKELKTGTQTDSCIPMFIATLFTVPKSKNDPGAC
jgi:hypothetical protein